MIEGDIDLTENLDFLRDRKEPEYRNSRDFKSPIKFDTENKWVWTATDSYSYRIINTATNNVLWLSEDPNVAIISSNDSLDSTLSYHNDPVSNITWVTSSNISTGTTSFSVNYTNNCSNLLVYNDKPKEPTVSEKLFGKRPNKYYEAFHLKFGIKPKKDYFNAKEFDRFDPKEIRYRIYQELSWGEIRSYKKDIRDLFGIREEDDPYIDHDNESPVPWFKSLREFNRHIRQIKQGEEEEDNISYLTNYSWLGIHR